MPSSRSKKLAPKVRMQFDAWKEKYDCDNKKVAELFGFKNVAAFENSSAAPRYVQALLSITELVLDDKS